jgi:4-hydroxybenzoyl-CoA thioesterase
LTVFIDRGADGRAKAVRPLVAVSDEDRRLDEHAVELMSLRDEMAVIPAGLARFS